MAYSGYLVKLGGSGGTILPMKYMKLEGYIITPNQRMEAEAARSITGLLHRTTVEHTATKIEFTTPNLTNKDVNEMMSMFRNAWSSEAERRLELQYYDMETDSYKTGTFYMPDIKFTIYKADNIMNTLIYKETRIAFIEY